MKREKFGSRMGFILVSAGCAIGIGNVWKFPYMCGEFGGAAFILIYLAFLLIMGIPVMVCEFAVGRGSRRSVAASFEKLEIVGTRWHVMKWIGVVGCYLLMMFYTSVGGWMMYYCFRSVKGEFAGASSETVAEGFSEMLGNVPVMTFWTVLICIIGFAVCYFGIQKGIERVSKVMMSALLVIMVALAVHSVFLEGAGEGIRFYLVPDFAGMREIGIGNIIFGAMSQAFFTLSIGIGAMQIFGSYIGRERSLTGEAVSITALDTFVALMAGFIIIPSCFAFGIEPGAGPSLIFITIPNIFAQMPGGRAWAALFFLFLTFAAFTTIVAVFENIISFAMDLLGWSRRKSVLANVVMLVVLSMPCVLGFNVLAGFEPLGAGTNIMDLEDFIVSNNLLPLGSLGYVLFCTRKNGWGWEEFLEEANAGDGIHFPRGLKGYVSYVLPVIIIVIYLKGYYDKFVGQGTAALAGWMALAVLFLGFVLFCAWAKPSKE
ncbi:MAG: sodium-dependent transporter [Dorea sp.]|nr:sodium-dependent transporter [Dorea sp.]MCI9452540.1 sodium-dependent transporter [Dorea sp.]